MPARLNVALDARLPDRPSGVGLYTTELMQALARQPEIRLTAVVRPHEPVPEGVERLETRVAFDAHGPAELFEHVTLPRLLEERSVDVLHGPNTIVPLGRTRFARVATIHDVAFQRFPETLTPKFRLLMRVRTGLALKTSDRVLAVSRFTADELSALYPEHAAKVVSVPSGTPDVSRNHPRDDARARALVTGLGLKPERFICAVGTLEPRKNLPMLLEAFRQARLSGVQRALVGDQGWRDGPLHEALSRMPEGSVVLTGWLDGPRMRDLLSQSSGLIYPSLYEGFGFPPLEALALGVPAACAELPPILESCDDRVLRVDPRDLQGWIRALERIVELPRPSPWWGRTFADVAEETVQLYREAVNAKRA